jgi:Ran GTPase-activating protein (RanGAP) involved in mRNA processing and transport
MSLAEAQETMRKTAHLIDIDDYRPLIGEESVERIVRKAKRLRGLKVVNISSTFTAVAWRRCCLLPRCSSAT